MPKPKQAEYFLTPLGQRLLQLHRGGLCIQSSYIVARIEEVLGRQVIVVDKSSPDPGQSQIRETGRVSSRLTSK